MEPRHPSTPPHVVARARRHRTLRARQIRARRIAAAQSRVAAAEARAGVPDEKRTDPATIRRWVR